MDVSVIIPCYNHGLYIQEAVDSVLDCKSIELEIIIVDDGSEDPMTLQQLTELEQQGFTVLRQRNGGPASARNHAIAVAQGKYILPVDADNKIKHEYLVKARNILDSTDFDIVYSNPIFFGEVFKKQRFVTKAFVGEDLFIDNYIDTCAMFRKTVWLELGGYDTSIPFYGNEDWEFWLHAYTKQFKFTYLDEPLFYYRVLKDSLISMAPKDAHFVNREYILKKHFIAFTEMMTATYNRSKMYERDMKKPLRASAKYLFRYLKKSLLNKDG